PTFLRRLRNDNNRWILCLSRTRHEKIDEVTVASFDLITVVVSSATTAVKKKDQRVLFLLVIIFRDVKPVRHGPTLRTFINFGNKNVFSFLSDSECSEKEYQDQTGRESSNH